MPHNFHIESAGLEIVCSQCGEQQQTRLCYELTEATRAVSVSPQSTLKHAKEEAPLATANYVSLSPPQQLPIFPPWTTHDNSARTDQKTKINLAPIESLVGLTCFPTMNKDGD